MVIEFQVDEQDYKGLVYINPSSVSQLIDQVPARQSTLIQLFTGVPTRVVGNIQDVAKRINESNKLHANAEKLLTLSKNALAEILMLHSEAIDRRDVSHEPNKVAELLRKLIDEIES